MAEIYSQDKLKLNLKFEIEMMFRNLNLQIGDAKPSLSLAKHKRQIINNADFTADKAMPPPQQAIPEKQASKFCKFWHGIAWADWPWCGNDCCRFTRCVIPGWLTVCSLVLLCLLACQLAYLLRSCTAVKHAPTSSFA